MNFLDAFDVSGPPTPTQNAEQHQQPSQSLNEEVNQVVGQLSRFWGGFRKQSQSVFETAKKDLGDAYTHAQKEITKLTEPASSSGGTTSTAVNDEHPEENAPRDDDEAKSGSRDLNTGADDKSQPTPSTSIGGDSGHARRTSQNFFSILQTSLPANLMASVQNVQSQIPDALKNVQNQIPDALKNVQNQLPDALKAAPGGSVDFGQLRSTLTTEFQRVQGITRAQAEEYVHKSEGLLREAQEFLKDAVKVVPPEEADGRSGSTASAGMLWDGSDFWVLPDSSGPSGKGKEKEVEASGKTGADGLRAVATRAESLLKQLKHDPEIVKVDPLADERAKELYERWVREKVDSEEGGLSGDHWAAITQQALDDKVDGAALKATHDSLVPEHITSETFWTRYFFRVHQVEQDEQRRKALIQATMADDEDFSWEDDDDETTSPTTAKSPSGEHALRASVDTLQAPRPSAPLPSEQSSPRTSEADYSRRQSSEGSYDVVSSQVSTSGELPSKLKNQVQYEEDEEDEDEEDDEDEDDDEDEEDEEDEDDDDDEEEGSEEKKGKNKDGSEEDSDWE
ncbi:hypothetical protein BXZ70DRAFT_1060706 [Cristinia sonorae]|uniref:BSD domain-containing protein n=1 Tax=Cristinia sonorae TaxID=1940300 RepID=A0A8K0XUV1_9AGAR|nr:hypothetical protein BXZ70DRAFT_1060706 [Cristinia sonorae]